MIAHLLDGKMHALDTSLPDWVQKMLSTTLNVIIASEEDKVLLQMWKVMPRIK